MAGIIAAARRARTIILAFSVARSGSANAWPSVCAGQGSLRACLLCSLPQGTAAIQSSAGLPEERK